MTPTDQLVAHLVQHETFVRRALGAILRNEAEVEDVVQETWIRALAHGRVPDRSWLARTARKVAVSRWRTDSRRRYREQSRGEGASVEPAADLMQRVEERQRVVQSVLALGEPYRGVVLMRYEDGLSVAKIAAKTGRSQGTVRSQLPRAHQQLRASLDAEFGDRRAWAGLVAPAAVRLGGGIGTLVTGLVAACVVAAVGFGAVRSIGGGAVMPAGQGVVVSELHTPLEAEAGAALAMAPVHETAGGEREAIVASQEEADARAASAARPYEERLLPRAELLERSYYDDYELATFSLDYGLRDDPGLALTRNSWSVQFQSGKLDVRFTRYTSWIADLGRVDPQATPELRVDALTYTSEPITPRQGHCYVILTCEKNATLATLIHVTEIQAGRRCVFDWYTTDGSGRAQGSIVDDRKGRAIVDALVGGRALQSVGNELKEPLVVLQLRAGAGGGNPNSIDMAGNKSIYVDKISQVPIDFSVPVERSDPSVAYVQGGILRADQTFVVTSIEYEGTAKGDSNGPGEFLLVVGGTEIVHETDVEGPFSRSFSSRVVIEQGGESETYLMVANSSTGSVTLRGMFEERELQRDPTFGRPSAGFLGDHKMAEREELPPLARPTAVLQVRAGAGGGNPNRIDLRGSTSMYVDHVRTSPLDFGAPVTSKTASEVYSEVGSVPEGQRFVVTRVRIIGTTADRSNGSGYILVKIGGETILERRESTAPIDEVWTGEVRIERGEESRAYAEVGNTSSVDVRLDGYFEAVD